MKRCFFAFLISFGLFGVVSSHVHILHSSTSSLPKNYFLHLPDLPPRKGQLTAFVHESRVLIKEILGHEGDRIHFDSKGHIWVQGVNVGKPFSQTSKGIPLSPLASGVIPKGYVFVFAPHCRSFDSRYHELGLIPTSRLLGRVLAVV